MAQELVTRPVSVGARTYAIASDDAYGRALGDVFEPGLSGILTAACPRGAVAVDVGANLGLTALLLSQVASHVHAFEAVPSTRSILEQNLASAHTDNVTVHPFGLGEQPGTVQLVRDRDNRSGAFVGDTVLPEGHEHEEGEIRTLDSFLEDIPGPVGLVKVDVEGFELPVLRGGRAFLAMHRPLVVLEMNHWCLNAFQRTSIPDFLDGLREVFPHLIALDDESGQVADLHDPRASYGVMHEHIVHFRFMTVLGCFDAEQAEPVLRACADRAAQPAPVPPPPSLRERVGRRISG